MAPPSTNTPAPLPNPAEHLGGIVSGLYELAGNSQVSAAQRQQLLLQAHDLRGDLVVLVATQFRQSTAAYQSALSNLETVIGALEQAEQDINQITAVVAGAGQLANSIDALLQEAAQLAAHVA